MLWFFCDQNFGFNPDFVEAVQIFWGFSLETFPLPAAFMAAHCALISAKTDTHQEQKPQTQKWEELKPKETSQK